MVAQNGIVSMMPAFPLDGGQSWALDAKQLKAWRDLYLRIDVDLELGKAWAWLEANPTRRKTARGMPRFLVAWLNRAQPSVWQDRVPMRQAYEQWRYYGGCPHTPRCPHFTACYAVSQRVTV